MGPFIIVIIIIIIIQNTHLISYRVARKHREASKMGTRGTWVGATLFFTFSFSFWSFTYNYSHVAGVFWQGLWTIEIALDILWRHAFVG
jgi:hypothetical protein